MLASHRSGAVGLLLAFAALLGACAQGAGTIAPKPKPIQTQQTAPAVPAASFDEWRDGFRVRALSQGIGPAIFDRAFRNVRLNERVQTLDGKQPEFSRPIWEYLDSAVSANRVATGRRHANAKRNVLDRIQARYGVDYPVCTGNLGTRKRVRWKFRFDTRHRKHGDPCL